MAQFRSFGATNDEHTCLWCGNRLRVHRKTPSPEAGETWAEFYKRDDDQKKGTGEIEGYGDYLDGFFCGLRCSYQFAVRLAKLGRRLSPTLSR